jgi:hypothetical protein
MRFSPVEVCSFLQVSSRARVATWCALEVPWGQVSLQPMMWATDPYRFKDSRGCLREVMGWQWCVSPIEFSD